MTYPVAPGRMFTDCLRLALDNSWMARTGGERLEAERAVVDGVQEPEWCRITDTVHRLSR